MTDVIQKIIDHKHEIIGITLNGCYYDVDYTSTDDAELSDMLANDDVILHCYSVEDGTVIFAYEFTVGDIKLAKDVKIWKKVEI